MFQWNKRKYHLDWRVKNSFDSETNNFSVLVVGLVHFMHKGLYDNSQHILFTTPRQTPKHTLCERHFCYLFVLITQCKFKIDRVKSLTCHIDESLVKGSQVYFAFVKCIQCDHVMKLTIIKRFMSKGHIDVYKLSLHINSDNIWVNSV